MTDGAGGYEANADAFVAARSAAGANVARGFARRLPTGARVLDVGAGFGWPITSELVAAGCRVVAIEPAPTLASLLRTALPQVAVRCERAEAAAFRSSELSGIVMIGVLFLLEAAAQRALLAGLGDALGADGRLLFSAPWQAGAWTDVLTGRPSRSLGATAYEAAFSTVGLSLTGRHLDEGGSHYFEAVRS